MKRLSTFLPFAIAAVLTVSLAQAQTTVQTTATAPVLSKAELKSQKKTQKDQEKSAKESSKAAKDQSKALKHQDKSTDAAEKAQQPK